MSQEIIFKKVRFKNFQSFGAQWIEISLLERGTTLIVGENLDDGGSSGAGKTTALAAVSYCLFDKIPSGVSKDRMINRTNDKKNTSMEAEFYFSIGTDEYKVHRSRGVITGVHLYLNDKDITPASVGAVNATIESLVGFSYNLFTQIVLFNGNARCFLDMSVGEQRNLIEELFKITLLTRKSNALKKQASETTREIDLQKALIKQQEVQIETHRKRVKEAQERVERWNDTRSQEVRSLELEINKISNIDFETEEVFHQEIDRLSKLKSELTLEVNQLKYDQNSKEHERSPLSEDRNLRASQIKKKTDEAEVLRSEIGHLESSKCPYCLQDYQDAKIKLEEKRSRLNILTAELKVDEIDFRVMDDTVIADSLRIKTELAEIKKCLTDKNKVLTEVMSEFSAVTSACTFKKLGDAITLKNSLAALQEKLEKKRSEINPHVDAARALEAEGEVKIDRVALDELIDLQVHQQFMVKLLTDKNSYVRKNLISTTTPFLNKRIGYYIERLNLPHVVLFQSDMSCQISQLGRELDHGNLSNGEKKKLNLSICLSFRDVMTYLHTKVNVLFTDEVDGGSLSGGDIDSLITLLKHKAWDEDLSIFVVSHRPEFEGRCDRNLVVRKEGGFSTLITQPDD